MRASLTALVAFVSVASSCKHPPTTTTTAPGDSKSGHVEVSHARADPNATLRAGGLTASFGAIDGKDGFASVHLDGLHPRGPIYVEAELVDPDGQRTNRLVFEDVRAVANVAEVSRAVAKREGLALEGALHTTVAASETNEGGEAMAPRLSQQLRVTGAKVGSLARLRLRLSRLGGDVRVGEGAPVAPDATIAKTHAPFVVLDGETAVAITSSGGRGVDVVSEGDLLVVEVELPASVDGSISGDLTIAVGATARASTLVAREVAATTAGKGATVAFETVVRGSHAPIPARILIDATPTIPRRDDKDWPIYDPTRHAEPTAPKIDTYVGRTVVSMPAGHYAIRATHGIGWSIAKTSFDVADGDAMRVPLELVEEQSHDGWIGCDLHVHSQGSFDAREVTYEDRVRSLAAVGVDCAAATEHDHVGDYGPAMKKLQLEDRFRAMRGVELTTAYGHFNVYPWPDGKYIPSTSVGTVPQNMFAEVNRLSTDPDAFIFQVNHPRMRTGNGHDIGYFNLAGYDGLTGAVKGGIVAYVKNYDALEVYNGYQTSAPDRVRAMIDEWLAMLERGERHVATGSSDSHWISYPWAGFPRTYVEVGSDWIAKGRSLTTFVHALKAGRAFVTSGPLVSVRVGESGIGDTVRDDKGVSAHVEVQVTSWMRAPTLTVRVGTSVVRGVDGSEGVKLAPVAGKTNVWSADVAIPAVDKKRPLVVIAESEMSDDARGFSGISTSLGFSNPVWLTP